MRYFDEEDIIAEYENQLQKKDKEIERLNTNLEVANEDLTRIAQLLNLEEGCTIYDIEDKIERLKQGYCELKEKCNKGECDCTHEEYNNMCEQNIKMDLEIERLNNIINEYDIFLKHELSFEGHSEEWIENKLQELKGSDKE